MGNADAAGSGAALGEGTDEMMKTMLLEMPITALVGFGVIDSQKLEEIMNQLNG